MDNNTDQPRLRAVGYSRISLDRKDGAGVERQAAMIGDMAATRGYELVTTLVENSVSAYSGVQRPEYTRLLDLIRAGSVDRVIVWNLDRLHRSVRETLEYMELTREAGVVTEAVQGAGLDPTTADAFLTTTVLAAVAENESRHRGERIQAAYRSAAMNGQPFMAGRRTYGYQRQDGGLVLDTREAGHLRQAAENILAGGSIRREVARMNDAGERTTADKPFTGLGLRTLLTNPRLAGLSTWAGKDTRGRAMEREVVGEGNWPAVFPDRERWEALQAILRDPARTTNRVGNTPAALGSGLYVCGHCGLPMFHRWRTYRNGTRRPFYYTKRDTATGVPGPHVTRVSEDLDRYVSQVLLHRLATLDLSALTTDTDNGERVADLTDQRNILRERIHGVELAVVAGDFTPAQGGKMNRQLAERLEAVETELAGLRDQDHALAGLVDVPDLAAWWEAAELEDQRAVLRSLATVALLPGANSGRNFQPEYVEFRWKV